MRLGLTAARFKVSGNLPGALALSALLSAAGAGYTLHAARAAGIPQAGALVYSGQLTDATGAPLTSPQNVGVVQIPR